MAEEQPEPSLTGPNGNGWTHDVIETQFKAGKLTFLPSPSKVRTILHRVPCHMCYQWFPRVNRLHCCSRLICSSCVANYCMYPLADAFCPRCHRNIGDVDVNVDDTFPGIVLEEDQSLAPPGPVSDARRAKLMRIAAQHHLDLAAVKELIDLGAVPESVLVSVDESKV
jgi:hypothetical protein